MTESGPGSTGTPTPRPAPGPRRRRLAIGCLGAVLIALVAAIGGFLWWAQPQPLLPEASAALASTPGTTFTEGSDGRLTWTPTSGASTVGLVLYTGGKVPPAAYAPAARAIAEQGHLVAIVPAPFNLAILASGAARAVIDDHPEVSFWAVGGHSLGGATAALFVDGNPGVADGLVLWASYSSADLADDGVLVSSSYGTLDAGVPSFTSPENVAKLGPAVVFTSIEGGNHEQMGWYTGQPNDPPATISREAQQDRIVAATSELLDALEEPPLP
ncbi:MAG: alpha/beta hydrolase [Chloroflexota bacterium]|nr:alpha/beta hydrolase [Chloroflexota bacterium]MDH5243910.1 alpha/beta hydrolase [Chloroflexota bacterium]